MKILEQTLILKGSIFIFELNLKNDYLTNFNNLKYEGTGDDHYPSKISKNLNVLNSKNFKELKLEINKCFKYVINNIYEYHCNFSITKSWATQTKQNEYSMSHRHSNSWLSAVYYPDYDPSFTIEFYNDVHSAFITVPKNYNIYNSTQWKFTPKKNSLIIFPSELRHKILMNNSQKTRYSLSLNVLPQGVFGYKDTEVFFKCK
jgi:uncharacterized protein (TIGR02466 family)